MSQNFEYYLIYSLREDSVCKDWGCYYMDIMAPVMLCTLFLHQLLCILVGVPDNLWLHIYIRYEN